MDENKKKKRSKCGKEKMDNVMEENKDDRRGI
jgi:hypothetical protein